MAGLFRVGVNPNPPLLKFITSKLNSSRDRSLILYVLYYYYHYYTGRKSEGLKAELVIYRQLAAIDQVTWYWALHFLAIQRLSFQFCNIQSHTSSHRGWTTAHKSNNMRPDWLKSRVKNIVSQKHLSENMSAFFQIWILLTVLLERCSLSANGLATAWLSLGAHPFWLWSCTNTQYFLSQPLIFYHVNVRSIHII